MDATNLVPYLFFDGNAKEGMEFYQSIFGGELTHQTHGEAMGDKAPAELKDQTMHAALTGQINLFGSDMMGDKVSTGGKVTLCLGGSDEAKLTKYFEALSEGGNVNSPLKKEFWGDTFGALTDKYGFDWMVNIAGAKPSS